MISNSQPITSSYYGQGSGRTREELNQNAVSTTETLLGQQVITKLNGILPKVPSNQKIAKGK